MNRGQALDAILTSGASGPQRLILLEYVRRMPSALEVDHPEAVAWPGCASLGAAAGVTTDTAREWRRLLVVAGVLVVAQAAQGRAERCRIDWSALAAYQAPRKLPSSARRLDRAKRNPPRIPPSPDSTLPGIRPYPESAHPPSPDSGGAPSPESAHRNYSRETTPEKRLQEETARPDGLISQEQEDPCQTLSPEQTSPSSSRPSEDEQPPHSSSTSRTSPQRPAQIQLLATTRESTGESGSQSPESTAPSTSPTKTSRTEPDWRRAFNLLAELYDGGGLTPDPWQKPITAALKVAGSPEALAGGYRYLQTSADTRWWRDTLKPHARLVAYLRTGGDKAAQLAGWVQAGMATAALKAPQTAQEAPQAMVDTSRLVTAHRWLDAEREAVEHHRAKGTLRTWLATRVTHPEHVLAHIEAGR